MIYKTTISDTDTWMFRSPTDFNKIYVNGLSGIDGAIILNGENIYSQLSGNTNTISALQGLSGNWQDTYTIVAANSTNWIDTYTTVVSNSATTWLGDSAVDALVHSTSGDWNSVYTVVCTNSSTWESNISSLSTEIRDLSSTYLTIVDASIEYQPIGSYLSGSSILNDLNDVQINLPIVDQVFKYNGTKWINGNSTSVNGGAGVDYFYVDSPSDIIPYSILDKIPLIATELDETVTCLNNKVYLDGYISPLSGLGGVKIDAGVWTFDVWSYVDVNNSDSHILLDLYTYDISANETFLFSVSSGLLTDILTLYSITTIQPTFTISSTDRLLVKVYGETIALSSREIHFIHGGNEHYSHFNTPLVVRHNDLAGLQGGSEQEHYHLDLVEHTKLTTNIDSLTSVDTQVRTLSTSWSSAYTSLSNYAHLSGASFTSTITASAISIDTHIGYTNTKRIVLMDEDGDSFMVYLRGGVLTID